MAILDWWGGAYYGGSYGFNYPVGIAFDGTHIWVTNYAGSSVTELDASDGAWVQTLTANNYGFDYPWGIAFDGSHIWVADSEENVVTDIPAG